MSKKETKKNRPLFTEFTLDMFSRSSGRSHSEIKQFNQWRDEIIEADKYTFETPHLTPQDPEISVRRIHGDEHDLVNFSSYNYLGYANHPEVIQAAKDALDTFGLGATGSPVLNGTFDVHKQLEDALTNFYGQEGYGVSLFSSGYGANIGVVSSYIHKGDYVVLDHSSHASLIDGAVMSQGTVKLFRHNDAEFLEKILKRISKENRRILVCVEGVYSTDGDYGNLKDLVAVSKKYGASILVDEAHSLLIAGKTGKGAVEEFDVLSEVDLVIGTFSKSFGGVGGCVYAKKELINYMNYYARSRMFSCALDPAVTGGILKALELAAGPDGDQKRKRIIENADYLRSLLKDKVDIGTSQSWVIPIIFGDERKSLPLGDYLMRLGYDFSIMMFPAVKKNKSIIRAFVTSEHTKEQLDGCAEALIQASKEYKFNL
ncbi:MAG: aminotransferase class I/II-fold pyridoxal phosphate-dependent enzyme [Candidatus Neomarinimicrobiota bacterium]|nr:aminotransferase class I/II-fold pyridoxal phosphate-dependent enzyme [Candidatus Neomarinimicrobiota bacterium]|tara:strand:- start:2427 stop:3716 length:1290 start_codon:yes stop_codon:yes gene_type:complete